MSQFAILIGGLVLGGLFIVAVARLFWPSAPSGDDDITGPTAIPPESFDGHGGFH